MEWGLVFHSFLAENWKDKRKECLVTWIWRSRVYVGYVELGLWGS